MSEADHNAIAQFNFVGQQNVLQQEQSRPGSGWGKQPDLSLSLGRQDTSGLLRSTSLASSLAINERAPPPPRDFLSLSRSYSLPTGPGLQHQQQQLQHHNLARWHQQAEAPLLEYQKRRLLEQQRSARDHPTLPSTQRHHQVPIMQQQVTALQQAVPVQQWNQQAVVLPQNQVVVLPQSLHHHLQQQPVVVVPPPTQQQLPQQQVFVVPPSQVLLASSPPNVAAAVASATTNPALSRALGHTAPRTGQSSGTINTPAEGNCSSPPNRSTRSALNGIAKSRAFRLGSSNSTSAPMEVAPVAPATQAANNRGKQPLVPRSDTDPLPISSSEKTDSESVAKKMRLMKEMGLEDGIELLKQMPAVAYKAAEMKRTEGFLYRYREGEISIVCNCHGTFLTPAEFVEHAGGADVDNPMKYITVCSSLIP